VGVGVGSGVGVAVDSGVGVGGARVAVGFRVGVSKGFSDAPHPANKRPRIAKTKIVFFIRSSFTLRKSLISFYKKISAKTRQYPYPKLFGSFWQSSPEN
jgi:hypothetical protein